MTEIHGEGYGLGRLTRLEVSGRQAFIIAPVDAIDEQCRWVWYAPAWLAVLDWHSTHVAVGTPWPGDGAWPRESHSYDHSFYVPRLLAAGFHLAGVDVGTSCGSPRGAAVSHDLYRVLVRDHGLNERARLLGQSNGGLIHYAWAVRHPECVDRILGIMPATDLRSWPGLERACGSIKITAPGLGYDMTPDELEGRLDEFNPIQMIAPLAAHGVKILHIHGERDTTVPPGPNSTEFANRYRDLGGDLELIVVQGGGHSNTPPFYESERAVDFLVS